MVTITTYLRKSLFVLTNDLLGHIALEQVTDYTVRGLICNKTVKLFIQDWDIFILHVATLHYTYALELYCNNMRVPRIRVTLSIQRDVRRWWVTSIDLHHLPTDSAPCLIVGVVTECWTDLMIHCWLFITKQSHHCLLYFSYFQSDDSLVLSDLLSIVEDSTDQRHWLTYFLYEGVQTDS